jgi:hypothetical protein
MLSAMADKKTERSSCRFVINSTKDGKPQIVVKPFHPNVSLMANAVPGFDLLGGTTLEPAKKVAKLLKRKCIWTCS